MEALSYASHIATNFSRNLVPIPNRFVINPLYLDGCTEKILNQGLTDLHDTLSLLYEGAVRFPQDFHLPDDADQLPRQGKKYNAATRAFLSIPNLLYGLGQCGMPSGEGLSACLLVDLASLAAFCLRARLNNRQLLLNTFRSYGIQSEADRGFLSVYFMDAPEISFALPVFAQACAPLSQDGIRPPLEFYRADLRVIQPQIGNRRSAPLELEDALRALGRKQIPALTTLDRLVTGLGFRLRMKCSGLGRGEWQGSYTSSRLGKTLLSFVVSECRLTVTVNLNQTEQIMPLIEQAPAEFQRIFFASCACQSCAQCQSGPLEWISQGQVRRLCHSARLTLLEISYDHLPAIQQILAAQVALIKASQNLTDD